MALRGLDTLPSFGFTCDGCYSHIVQANLELFYFCFCFYDVLQESNVLGCFPKELKRAVGTFGKPPCVQGLK